MAPPPAWSLLQQGYADKELQSNREDVLLAVSDEGTTLRFLFKELQADREVVLAAVSNDGSALEFASKELQADREVVLAAAAAAAFKELRADHEVVLAAVSDAGFSGFARGRELTYGGSALEFASKELQADREVLLAAAAAAAFAKMQAERGVVFEALRSGAEYNLASAPEKLKADRDLVIAVVSKEGRALEYASEKLRADRVVVRAAVSNNGLALEYASKELQGDRKVVIKAMSKDASALKHASEELRTDRRFVMDSMSSDYDVFESISEELQSDLLVLLAAADRNVADAQFRLASMHATGSGGLALDKARAQELYTLAAKQGHSEAQLRCTQSDVPPQQIGKRTERKEASAGTSATDMQAVIRIKREAQDTSTRLQGRASRLAPCDVLLLCSPATDLEKHHEVIVVNKEVARLRPLSFYDDRQTRKYQAVPLMSVAEARSRHGQYIQECYPMPAVLHLICHSNKSALFELDEDVHFKEVVRLFVTGGTHVLLNCCNGWQCKGSQIVKIAPGSGMCPPSSLLAWRIQPDNDMCIALTEVYYELLAQPGGHAASLAARVVADSRVQALTVGGRPLRGASLHGAEALRGDPDLVAWQA